MRVKGGKTSKQHVLNKIFPQLSFKNSFSPLFSFFHSRRSFLTMLEMLIVMMLIAITAAVVSIKILDMLKQQKFRTGADLIVDKLGIAQSIMLVFKTEVTLTLKPKPNNSGMICNITAENPLPKELAKIMNLYQDIDGVKSVLFQNDRAKKQEDEVVLKFSNLSKIVPKGILTVSGYPSATDKGDLVRNIYLAGYPRPINFEQASDDKLIGQSESEALFPSELREKWKQKLDAAQQVKNTNKENDKSKNPSKPKDEL